MICGHRQKPDSHPKVASYRFSVRAARDIEAIAEYTIEALGIAQARRYRDSLADCFSRLTKHPEMGRSCDDLAPNLKRFDHESHIVFYLVEDQGLFIVRLLHQRMDVSAHFQGSEINDQ